MSYDTINNAIRDIIEKVELAPASVTSFEEASSTEYGNTYILKPISGEMDRETSETLSDRFYDIQMWSLQIAFSKETHTDVIGIDTINRKREAIQSEIDDPANWQSYARLVSYESWELVELPNYYILDIKIKIVDTITY